MQATKWYQMNSVSSLNHMPMTIPIFQYKNWIWDLLLVFKSTLSSRSHEGEFIVTGALLELNPAWIAENKQVTKQY